jgi:predicted protein tyrosine phosphatase
MKIIVLNKKDFNDLMLKYGITDDNVEQRKDDVFISINNTYGDNSSFFNSNKNNVKIMYFDDCERNSITLIENKPVNVKAFTKKQAKELFNFIKKNINKNNWIIHCSAGISRSGAVGTFINDYFGLNWFEFKNNNPKVIPNNLILRLLKREMYKKYEL